MKILATPLQGLAIVETDPFRDERGEFTRAFCANELGALLQSRQIAQVNLSSTHLPGTIRGLHFQRHPHGEMKFVRCTRGSVWDVAVDLRPHSPTFLRWHAEIIGAGDRRMMVIPEGFAHGFQTLEPDCELLYLMTAPYRPASAAGIRWDDPALAIAWPLPQRNLSSRDAALPRLDTLDPHTIGAAG